MTTEEAAEVLSVSVGRVKHLITNGTLSAVSRPRVGRGGNEWHIDSTSVLAYAERDRKVGRPLKRLPKGSLITVTLTGIKPLTVEEATAFSTSAERFKP